MAALKAQREQEQVVVEDAVVAESGTVARGPASESLVVAESAALEESPAAVYLAHLAAGSRRTMRTALETMATLLSSGRAGALTLAWGRVSYQHTAALRSLLAERYAPATANKMLAALRTGGRAHSDALPTHTPVSPAGTHRASTPTARSPSAAPRQTGRPRQIRGER